MKITGAGTPLETAIWEVERTLDIVGMPTGTLDALSVIVDAARSAADPAALTVPVIDAIIATIRRDDLCEDTDGEHHTDEYITAFLLSLDTELRARAAIRENAADWGHREITNQ